MELGEMDEGVCEGEAEVNAGGDGGVRWAAGGAWEDDEVVLFALEVEVELLGSVEVWTMAEEGREAGTISVVGPAGAALRRAEAMDSA